MKEKNWHIICLLSRWLTGNASADEEQELKAWRAESARHRRLWQEVTRAGAYEEEEKKLASFPADERWAHVRKRLRGSGMFGTFGNKYLRYAAAFLVTAGLVAGAWYAVGLRSGGEQLSACNIRAGVSSAELVLGNRQTITLSTDNQCIYNELQGISILQSSGSLRYRADGNLPDTLVYNQVRTFTGMEYQIVLAEGTHIYLNAESRLTYPVFFQSAERNVSFEGEGYFQVAKDAEHPFVIRLGDAALRVLGTSFNLRAYADEPQIQITLEEGVLEMNNCRIYPGEQLIYDKESHTVITRSVNPKEFVAWHEGYFLFRNERLEDILHYLARWYDFTYTFTDEAAKNIRIGAYFERYNSMQPILNMLQRTELVTFTVKDRTIEFSSNP